MNKLTDRQQEILGFIDIFMRRNGMAPTVYEIAEKFGMRAPSAASHLRSLQQKGALERSSKARSIVLNRPRVTPKVKHMSFMLPIPVLGRINAGLPLESSGNKEGEIYVDASWLGSEDATGIFALKVRGESMRDLGIMDGDTVIVRQTHDYRKGDVVVATIEGGETTVKSFERKESKILLHPANPEFKVQEYEQGLVALQGKVVGLQRRF